MLHHPMNHALGLPQSCSDRGYISVTNITEDVFQRSSACDGFIFFAVSFVLFDFWFAIVYLATSSQQEPEKMHKSCFLN